MFFIESVANEMNVNARKNNRVLVSLAFMVATGSLC